MLTKKYIRGKINLPHKYYSRWEKELNERRVAFIVDYCKYLEGIFQAMPNATIHIEQKDNSQRLIVDYITGSSSVCLDEIFANVLIPEVRKVLVTLNKTLAIHYIHKPAIAA